MDILQRAQLKNEQRQSQVLSMRQQQSLEVLQMPLPELEQYLEQQLNSNPLLEEAVPEADVELPPPTSPPSAAPDFDDDFADDDDFALPEDRWHEDLPLPPESTAPGTADFLAFEAAPGPSLAEQLESELATCRAPEKIRRLAAELVSQLDDRGYLTTPLADVAMTSDAELSEVEAALRLVQSFDPPGIGARDLAECLALQLERRGQLTPVRAELLQSGLEDIAANRLPQLAKKLDLTLEQLKDELAILRQLDPAPGISPQQVASAPVELEFFRDGTGKMQVELRNGREEKLMLSPRYQRLLLDPSLDRNTRSYLNEKLAAAKEVLRALALRESTLLRVGREILRTQNDYFELGEQFLRPLTMKQTAEALQLHEATVSRAVAGKFAATPHGVKPLRFFFSRGYNDDSGQEVAATAVKAKLKELIDAEDPHHPYSDAKLSELLRQAGLPVARRTIAKYRESLHIASAAGRKQF